MPAINELEKTENEIEIIWRAFELRPEPAPLPDATSEFFTNMWRDSIYPLAESLDIEIEMPTVKPRSRIAHEAAKWAESVGRSEEFRNAVFRAYFEHDLDIGKSEVIISIAKDADFNAKSLSKALASQQFLESVLTDENDAARLGLNGVPAFIADETSGMMGIQSVENLRKLIESVRS